jgi:uncharacterized membrane protein
MNKKRPIRARVTPEEYQLLQQLRERKPAQNPPTKRLTAGEHLSDAFAATMGSWRFIVIQSIILFFWVLLNIVGFIKHWDPYPFILLNLMLSFQAAYAAPIIMMSQNRQADIDRADAKHDYEVNMKAELEIELLHDKINLLREEDIVQLTNFLVEQQEEIKQLKALLIEKLDSEMKT